MSLGTGPLLTSRKGILDRFNYQIFLITTPGDLERLESRHGSTARLALALSPTELDLMRDMKFISSVGIAARKLQIPVIISGSTLAHAYFALMREGCTVVASSEKDHSRVRRSSAFGKIVRDKIPLRIANRKEAESTYTVQGNLKKGFLTSKLLEEALEVRNSQTLNEKKVELADLYEVLKALTEVEGFSIEEIAITADEKRVKTGGFAEGIVLLQTGIMSGRREIMHDNDKLQVLGRKISGRAYELPFTFFGFMEMDQARSFVFQDLGIRLDITLKAIELRFKPRGSLSNWSCRWT